MDQNLNVGGAAAVQAADATDGLRHRLPGPLVAGDQELVAIAEAVALGTLDPHDEHELAAGAEVVGLLPMLAGGGGVDAGALDSLLRQHLNNRIRLSKPRTDDKCRLADQSPGAACLDDMQELAIGRRWYRRAAVLPGVAPGLGAAFPQACDHRPCFPCSTGRRLREPVVVGDGLFEAHRAIDPPDARQRQLGLDVLFGQDNNLRADGVEVGQRARDPRCVPTLACLAVDLDGRVQIGEQLAAWQPRRIDPLE